MFRILALAGGGLRGAYGIGFLEALEEKLDRPLTDYFDLIAGTSTGAITAATLCRGSLAAEVRAFYEKHSNQIFHPRAPLVPRSYLRPVYPLIRKYLQWRSGTNIDHFFRSRYCPHKLKASMVDGLSNETMSDAKLCRLLIPTVNLTDGETYVFSTPHLDAVRPEYEWLLADIIVAATAAPTYFPHKDMPNGKAYADGGLWAIDPGVVALSEATRILTKHEPHQRWESCSSEVHLLSIGTGHSTYSLAPPGSDAGSLFWAPHIADVMSISQVQGTQLPLSLLLGDRYTQVNFPLQDASWTLDNTTITDQLFELGRKKGAELFPSLRDEYFRETTKPYTSVLSGSH